MAGIRVLDADATVEASTAPAAIFIRVRPGVVDQRWRPLQTRLLQPRTSSQRYRWDGITTDPRPNGRPPRHDTYRELVGQGFAGWQFKSAG